MALITFMSDFGTADHYVATVKGKILTKNPAQQIIDISHAIRPYDISHAATVLKSTFKDFPAGTIHLVAIDAVREKSDAVALALEEQFFVGFDCGLFSMISEKQPDSIVKLNAEGSTFPAKDVMADAAVRLANGTSINELGDPMQEIARLFARQLKVTKKEIVGNIVNVDHYGNLITNITKNQFDEIMKVNGNASRFVIRFGRESFDHLNNDFTDVESGDCFVLFNSIGHLQIGINKGDASQLLGLGIDAPVHIEF